MADLTKEEKEALQKLREDVGKDISLAMANFKIWLLVTVLSNVVLVGVPALYVFFSTTNTAQTALTTAMSARERLDDRGQWIAKTDARIAMIERYLHERDQRFEPAPTPSLPK